MNKSCQLSVVSCQKKIILLVLSFWFLVFGLSGCQSQHLYKDTQVIMGTFVEVISPHKDAAKIAFEEIKRIDGLLSKYKENSEISRLNKFGRLKVSPETFYIIKKARKFWLASDGAFDITVAPLIDLWGFTDKKYYLPKGDEVKKALNMIGFDKIIFNSDNNMVKFKIPGMQIDLGGIAKGYAVDCAVNKLKEKGIKSCLINAGGQTHCLGNKFGRPWRVAIRNPRKGDLLDYLELQDKAVATSGDYEQYFVRGERRYSHILNPKTGYPADSGVISVTVIANDGITADALSTSIFVLGKKKGEELAKRFTDVQIKIIEENEFSGNS